MKLHILGRLDGTGSCIYYCLYMMALGYKYNYDVVFKYINTGSRPNFNRDQEIIDFFGIKLIWKLPKLKEIDSIKYFLENKLYEKEEDIYIKQWYNYTEIIKENILTIDEIFSKEFIDDILKKIPKYDTTFNKEHYNIGIHLRRGDVDEKKKHRPPDGGGKFKGRFVHDDYYIKILDKLYEEKENASLYIFTDEKDLNKLEKYKKYKNLVIFNTERDFKKSNNVLRDWKTIIKIDCFIFGISTFAYVPAIFNKNKKIYFKQSHDHCNQYTMKDWELV